jgi:hypothetical protein
MRKNTSRQLALPTCCRCSTLAPKKECRLSADSGSLLNALDLACENLLGPSPSKWTAELCRLRDRCAQGPERRQGLACPACTYAYEEELPDWTRSPVYLGRNRWLAVKVLTRTLEECPACQRRLPADRASRHREECVGKSVSSPADGSQEREQILAEREEEIKAVLFSYWKNILLFANPECYGDKLADLLRRFGGAQRPVLLQELTAVGVSEAQFTHPAPIRVVLTGLESPTMGFSLKATYFKLLLFLRHVLSTALKKGFLPEKEFRSRDDTLEHFMENARAAVVQRSSDGLTYEMRVGPRTRPDFPDPERPDLHGFYTRYVNSPMRLQLLERIANWNPVADRKASLKDAAGFEWTSPVAIRNVLVLEVFLHAGTSVDAVTASTLAQFKKLFDRSSVQHAPESVVGASREYHWVVELSEPPGKTVLLYAQGLVVRAIASYAKHLRPTFLKGREPGSTEQLPLFPLEGGARMRTLVSSLYLFFKLSGGGKPDRLSLAPNTIWEVKEQLVKEVRIREIVRGVSAEAESQ